MRHIISNFRDESMQQIVSGIHDPHDILQNLSEQDICFDSKDLIHRERNAVDLYDQHDSKGQMSFISFKEGSPNTSPKDHSVGKEHLKSAAGKVSSISVAQCNEAWNIGNRTFGLTLVHQHVLSAIQQLHRYAIVFQNVLASNQRVVVEEATYNPLICYENSLWTKKQPAVFGSVAGWPLSYCMPSKDSD